MFGVRRFIVAVDGFDGAGGDQSVFTSVREEVREYAAHLEVEVAAVVPISVSRDENISSGASAVPWFSGVPLTTAVAGLEAQRDPMSELRLAVRSVSTGRGGEVEVSGPVEAGRVAVGEPVIIFPSARKVSVEGIVSNGGAVDDAVAGQDVTVNLSDGDLSAGHMIVGTKGRPERADQFAAQILCIADVALIPGRPYHLICNGQDATATITTIKHAIDPDTLEQKRGA